MGGVFRKGKEEPSREIVTHSEKERSTEESWRYSKNSESSALEAITEDRAYDEEKEDIARNAWQGRMKARLQQFTPNRGMKKKTKPVLEHNLSTASSRSMKKNIRLTLKDNLSAASEISVLGSFMSSHLSGEKIDLGSLKREYSELHSDGTTYRWDIKRMTTELSMCSWSGNYDGLQESAVNRDEIGLIILKALVANGANINTLTTHGRTPLQVAALAGDLEFCKELIEKGADLHAKSEAGETTLSLVKQWNKESQDLGDILEYLENLMFSRLESPTMSC